MDRPSRKTKVVNYCEAKDFDDDEDFACAKAPPSKKAREDVVQQEHKKSSSKSSSQETNSQSTLSQKSRRPLDVKLCERDLEAAITLSLLNNAEGIKDQSPTTKGNVKVQLPVDENTDPSSLHLSNCSVDGAILGLDEITSEKRLPAPSTQRKAATNASEEQRKKLKEKDENYEPKLTPDSESDEDFSEPDESEDEEFTVKKVSKTKKKEKVTKNEKIKSPPASKKQKQPSKTSKSKSHAAAVSTPVRSPPTAKLAANRPASSSTVSTPKPAAALSQAGGRIPKWNPPGQIGKSPTSSQSSQGKSPGQGLRLGLSRLVRVKPLHPSVASH
ncbi:RAD51-associated protein 1 [Seriola aureovittata]|uniref:RAD51-associated protein 1 n=1 Tax=Seriola aureovittata TaxID=2871759 RepID=UPI0024BE1619|nr:RAD51-associated protein 1 [Seriola aureovittata]